MRGWFYTALLTAVAASAVAAGPPSWDIVKTTMPLTGGGYTASPVTLASTGVTSPLTISGGVLRVTTAFSASVAALQADVSALTATVYGYRLNVVTASSDVTPTTTADVIACSVTTGFTVTLPLASNTGKILIVKDVLGTATGPDPITVSARGLETIDGASSATISSAFGVLRVVSDGLNWVTW